MGMVIFVIIFEVVLLFYALCKKWPVAGLFFGSLGIGGIALGIKTFVAEEGRLNDIELIFVTVCIGVGFVLLACSYIAFNIPKNNNKIDELLNLVNELKNKVTENNETEKSE